jgi:hypothetical protein
MPPMAKRLVACACWAAVSALGCSSGSDLTTDPGGASGPDGSSGSGGSVATGGSTGSGGWTAVGGSSGAADSGIAGESNVPALAPNVIAVFVNGGPAAPASAYVNGLFASVTLCIPGTATCQTIDDMLVDTASSGIRVLSSALTLALPREQDTAGNPIAACAPFADGSFLWGEVARADIRMSGERASSVPIQIAADPASSSFPAPPAACSSGGGTNLGAAGGFPANGILGVSFFLQDCGDACVSTTSPGIYFRCVASTCTATTVALADQIVNPASMFAADNNGVVIALPSVPPEGSASVTGTLTFGIGTEANNGLGPATVLFADSTGNIRTVLDGQSYGSTTIYSGSNATFFASSAPGLTACQAGKSFYCPASTLSFSASISGARGSPATVAFDVANADAIVANGRYAYANLAGSNAPAGGFSWGLPFFFGRTVFTAFEARSSPGGTGPYWAY